jgi:hypothetical protein
MRVIMRPIKTNVVVQRILILRSLHFIIPVFFSLELGIFKIHKKQLVKHFQSLLLSSHIFHCLLRMGVDG